MAPSPSEGGQRKTRPRKENSVAPNIDSATTGSSTCVSDNEMILCVPSNDCKFLIFADQLACTLTDKKRRFQKAQAGNSQTLHALIGVQGHLGQAAICQKLCCLRQNLK